MNSKSHRENKMSLLKKICKTPKKLIFVIQKHHARQLHYDFRLEAKGVLKSWAIPKKPSMNPKIKRLAIMVEDHAYSYKDFEGEITEGYGKGTVSLWDRGTYDIDGDDAKTTEKRLLAGLKKGSFRFNLHGKKLKGSFAIVKLKTSEKNEWLLFSTKP